MMIVSQRFWADKTLRVALFARYGLVIVPAWFGAMKFTRSESPVLTIPHVQLSPG